MKTVEKIRAHVERIVDLFAMSISLLIFLIGFYALFDIYAVNVSAEMDEEVASLAPTQDADVNLKELQKINPEIIAWIQLNDTKINYPIVQAKNNTKYLTRNYRGEYATAGSIFLDYRNNKFNDDYSLVYGHRMDGQLMFGGISLFAQRDYFKEHRNGTLYTENGNYDLEIISYSVVDIDRSTIYNHSGNRNGKNARIIKEALSFAQQSRNVEVSKDDQIIILSTCGKDSAHYRNVILAKMIKR